jgi:hypothetical protein
VISTVASVSATRLSSVANIEDDTDAKRKLVALL